MRHLSGALLIALSAIPLVATLAAPAFARQLTRRLSPAATMALTLLALTAALVTGLLLSLAAVVALAGVPALSGLGHWSPPLVRERVPIPVPLGLLATAVAVAALWSAARYLLRMARLGRRTREIVDGARPAGDLVVIDDPSAFAYAVPGRNPRIVASTGMLSTLPAAGRRFLLAHEEAHLRCRHHLYVRVTRLAAAANPLLRPIADAVGLTVERWADENAARVVGDRELAARTIATAALATTAATGSAITPVAELGAARTDVRERVLGLLTPPPRHHVCATVAAVVAIVCWIAGALVIGHIHGLMELSEAVCSR